MRGEIDEETVYNLTKALWEKIDKVNSASAGLSLVTLESALEAISAELHAGAQRYYKEIGLL